MKYNGELLETYIDKSVGVIKLKDKVFDIATEISLKEVFFSRIKLASLSPEIRVLLILSCRSVMGDVKHDQFVKSLSGSLDGEMKQYREENALSQFIKLMCGFDKLIVTGVCGSVIGSFLGAILSTDYRIVSEGTVFSFPHIKYETVPQGGLAYFLPRYLGMAKAKKILLSGEPLTASKACELGLVDEVVADGVFEEKCLEIAEKMTKVPPGVVSMTKRLMGIDVKGLEAYFKMETELAILHKMKMPSD